MLGVSFTQSVFLVSKFRLTTKAIIFAVLFLWQLWYNELFLLIFFLIIYLFQTKLIWIIFSPFQTNWSKRRRNTKQSQTSWTKPLPSSLAIKSSNTDAFVPMCLDKFHILYVSHFLCWMDNICLIQFSLYKKGEELSACFRYLNICMWPSWET